jgi:solute:Na+ symporter, SSS family
LGNFSILDYSIIVVYLAGLLILGFFLRKKATRNIQEYFLGGNKIPWWALGISGMASMMDMTGTMIIVSVMFVLGARGMFVEIRGGLILLMAFAMVYHGKWNRRSGCMTVAEWMEFRFGSGRPGETARLLQAIAVLLMTIGSLALFVKGSGLFLSLFLPWSPFKCALVLFATATIYTIVSGFYGVVFTDIFQSLFIIIAVFVVAIMAFVKFDNSAELAELALKVTGNAQWLSSTIPAHVEMPAAYSTFEKFSFAILFYMILTTMIGMSRSGGRPMYFGARSERECGTLSLVWILSSAFRWPLMAGFVILGLFFVHNNYSDLTVVTQAADLIKEYVPGISEHQWNEVTTAIINYPVNYPPELISHLENLFGPLWQEKLRMVSFYGTVNPEQILPAVILYIFPSGLKGIVFVALIAAAMSTFDTYVNQASAYFVKDIYQKFIRPSAGAKELIRMSYLSCLIIVTAGAMLGFYAKSVNEIWDWLMVGISGGMVLPGLLRWYWWRFNGIGYAVGVFFGMTAAIVQRTITQMGLLPDLQLNAPWVRLPLILCVSFIGILLGTYLTRPTDSKVLDNFYNTTRPFGFWRPQKQKLALNKKKEFLVEHRNDLISLLIAVPWQFLLYWTPVQFMFKEYEKFYISLALLIAASIGLYYFWYRNLPGASDVCGQKVQDKAEVLDEGLLE